MSTAQEITTPKTAANGKTVLVVDDDLMIRDLLHRTLELYGYTVLKARHAEEAVLLLEEHDARIDLLLTDVVMPGMPGCELARTLRARQPDLRVVLMSGYACDLHTRHTGHFIQKPFGLHEIRTLIERALSESSPDHAAP